jgi:uncharacterized membrane protein YgcG
LDNNWTRIQTDYMVPRFRAGDISGGLAAAQSQVAKRIEASKDEAIHPNISTTTVNEQATDLSGLWKFLLWVLLFGVAGAIAFFVIKSMQKKQDSKQEREAKRYNAVLYRNQCSTLVPSLKILLANETALNNPKAKEAQEVYDEAMEEFSRNQKSLSLDPNNDTLTTDALASVADVYVKLYNKFLSVKRILNGVEKTTSTVYTPTPHNTAEFRTSQYPTNYSSPTPPIPPSPSQRVVERTTVIHDGYRDNPGDMLTGMIIGEELANNKREEKRPEPVYNSSHEDDENTGGSTDWGGSSSDMGSGGGSSDFGSGSDSGGGGSTDW